jgi:putative ABC transport system ATP-binding protein
MNPLEAHEVRKTFRQGQRVVVALDGVSLTVAQGEFLAVMGASGSGKSTLLHLLAGLTAPSSGRIVVDGQDLSAMRDRQLTLFRRRRIGLVFQAFNLIPTLSAAENIALPLMLENHNGAQAQAKVEALLGTLGLEHRRTHRPDVMSGGEQQRVAIGRALAADPALILADEPTGNLDSQSSRSVCELLRNLSGRDGKTIVMVTHEPSVAAYAQRVAVMRDGRIIDSFPTSQAHDSQSLSLRYHQSIQQSSSPAS